ncbi:MAG: glycolate oxidase subunit GlcF [Proteobacteria bacterium]|nr:glycolate oxidase subunit GlcF [Pseudomonadota bacterium]
MRTCVHCGFCIATCPTYLLLGDERDSPRGRIVLMQNMLQSDAPPDAETVRHLDRCLSCLGCHTACPSGVDYSALIDTARAHIEKNFRRPWSERVFRNVLTYVLTRPILFALCLALGRIFAPLARRLPGRLGALARKLPARPAWPARQRFTSAHRAVVQPKSVRRRVALLPGCVQRVLAPGIDASAKRVLARQEMLLTPLPGTTCCGALAYHWGKTESGKNFARRIIAAFEKAHANEPIDDVLMTATGCTSFLKDYPRIFAEEPDWKMRAAKFAAKVKDFTELAAAQRVTHRSDLKIAFHPPCTLQHGQGIVGMGETLLTNAGFNLVSFADAHLCCGSAGSYSLFQPKIAGDLRTRKLGAIHQSGAQVIASANIGCLTHLFEQGGLPTVHIAELLDWAAGGPTPAALG